jgi:uncharacterized protein involved in exopolysaccharide biosynthesis
MKLHFAHRVLLVAAACGLLAYAATFTVSPRYRAAESLYFPMANAGARGPLQILRGGGDGGAGSVPLFAGGLSSPLVGSAPDAAIGIINSRSCLRHVVREHDLARVYRVSEGDAIKMLAGRLRAHVDAQGFLTIEADDEDPRRAARIIHSVRDYLQEMSSELSLNVSRRNREFVERQLAEMRADAAVKQAAFARRAGRPSANIDEMRGMLAEAAKQREEAQIRLDAARSEIRSSEDTLRKLLNQSGSFEGKVAAINALYQNLDSLTTALEQRRLDLEDATAAFTGTSAEVRAAREKSQSSEQVASDLLAMRKKNLEAGLEPTLMAAKAQIASLENTARGYDTFMKRLTSNLSTAARDYTDAEVAKLEFEASMESVRLLESELALARIAEERDPARFEVVDPAEPTDHPVYPRRVVIAGLVFFLAFAIQVAPKIFSSVGQEPVRSLPPPTRDSDSA